MEKLDSLPQLMAIENVWSQVACEKYSTSYKFHRTCLDNMSLSLGPRICLEELKGLNKCAG